MSKGVGSNLRVQVQLTCERIRLIFDLFSLFFPFFLVFFFFFWLFFLKLLLHTKDAHKILMGFFLVWPCIKCTSDCIVMNSYWTTLEYDECNVILHGIC